MLWSATATFAHDVRTGATAPHPTPNQLGPTWSIPPGVLFDNGSFVNSPGTGAAGADESVLQNVSLGLSTFGFDASAENGARVADDFAVVEPGWRVTSFVLFGYETDASTTTITSANVRLWNGPPSAPGSALLWEGNGEVTPASSGWTGAYRVDETTTGEATNRAPIALEVQAGGGLALVPGSYWLDWQLAGSAALGPFVPPVTIDGQSATGDASTFDGTAWGPANDLATATRQGLPFLVVGRDLSVVEVPTLGRAALTLLALGLAGAALFTRARRGSRP